MPLPPLLDPLINLIPRNSALNQVHRNPQDLHIFIPALIIEEQHLLKFDPTISMYALEVCRLAARIYLQVVEIVYCASRGTGGAGNLEEFKHFTAEVRGVRARGSADEDVFRF